MKKNTIEYRSKKAINVNSVDNNYHSPLNGSAQMSKVALLTAGHFINDSYNGFVAPLLPLLMVKLGFSLTLAGLLASIQAVSTSLSQPLFGHLADKVRKPFFVYLGPLLTSLFLSSIGLCSSYGMLIVAVLFAGIGTAAFHPQAAATAGTLSGPRRGLGMSIFVTGGNAGHSLGPVIILPIVAYFGLERTFVAVLPGLIISYLLFRSGSQLPLEHNPNTQHSISTQKIRRLWALVLLLIIVIVRAFVICGFSTFIPIFLQNQGFPLMLAGIAITVFQFSGAIGSLFGGGLSDRFGHKPVLIASIVLAVPMLFLFLSTNGYFALGFLALAGLFSFSSIPVNIIMAQELFPSRSSTVSSLIIGVGWGIGGLLVTPLGALADKIGIGYSLYLLTLVCLLGVAAIIPLPKTELKPSKYISN
jgi:FSR family fosmidomycin resistance protein-like MFS transporter